MTLDETAHAEDLESEKKGKKVFAMMPPAPEPYQFAEDDDFPDQAPADICMSEEVYEEYKAWKKTVPMPAEPPPDVQEKIKECGFKDWREYWAINDAMYW